MKIAVIGCGVMGSAFAKHFAQKNQVIVYDTRTQQTEQLASGCHCKVAASIQEAIAFAEVIFLGIKPADLPNVARLFVEAAAKDKIVLSILAGTPLSELQRHLPKCQVVRMMPNLALTCHQGVIGVVDQGLSLEVKQQVNTLLDGLGLIAWMPESKLDALTALSASGIGFVFLIIEAMIEGGIHMGLNSQEAQAFVLKTMEGAVAMLRESGKHPAELKLNISSPGGMTIEGLKEMEDRSVRSGIIHAILAAYERGKTL